MSIVSMNGLAVLAMFFSGCARAEPEGTQNFGKPEQAAAFLGGSRDPSLETHEQSAPDTSAQVDPLEANVSSETGIEDSDLDQDDFGNKTQTFESLSVTWQIDAGAVRYFKVTDARCEPISAVQKRCELSVIGRKGSRHPKISAVSVYRNWSPAGFAILAPAGELRLGESARWRLTIPSAAAIVRINSVD